MNNISTKMSCCGSNYMLQPNILTCYGKKTCVIGRDQEYWFYQGLNFCQDCFSREPGDVVTLNKNYTTLDRNFQIPKKYFVWKENVACKPEPIITCDNCHRQYHEICVLHLRDIFPEKYTCDSCLTSKGKERKLKFTAKGLQESELSSYMEEKVNVFLKEQKSRKDVTIRVLTNVEKNATVGPQMQSRYDWPQQFPYHEKSIFAFQKFDDVDICFFGMFVQEYNSDCPEPNARRIYISCMDTVPYCHFFEPKVNRRNLYHEIILSYLDFAKQRGYLSAHIWAYSHVNVDNYIFYCRPSSQKLLSNEELQNWFKKLFNKGVERKIIASYKNVSVENMESISQLPYFDEDYLPVAFERCIQDLNNETEIFKNKASLHVTKADIDFQRNFESINKWQMVNYKLRDADKLTYVKETEMSLLSKVSKVLTNYERMSYVINLHSADSNDNTLLPIQDPDPLNSSDNLFNREALYSGFPGSGFSTVRQAKYSTLLLLHFLNVCQIPICTQCKRQIDTRYKCTVCNNFILCPACYEISSHDPSHLVNKIGVGLDEGDSVTSLNEVILHTFSCFDQGCNLLCCAAKRNYLMHLEVCQKNDCVICDEFLAMLKRHTYSCQDPDCKIAFCAPSKREVQKRRKAIRGFREETLKNKINVMEDVKISSEFQENSQFVLKDVADHNSAAAKLQETIQLTSEQCVATQIDEMENCNAAVELQENIQLLSITKPSPSLTNVADCYETVGENILSSLNKLSLSHTKEFKESLQNQVEKSEDNLQNRKEKSNWCTLS